MTASPIDYLVVGHLAKDVKEDGFGLGGTVTYAAICAARLGRNVGVVTACEPGIDLQKVFPATSVSRAPSLTSTVFKNVYNNNERSQKILSRAVELSIEQVPSHWRDTRLVHLAPIAGEMATDIIDALGGRFVGLTLQGWLRAWDSAGRVSFKVWAEAPKVLPKVNAVVLSEADVAYREDLMDYFANLAPVAVVTLGRHGARVHWEGAWYLFPAFPAKEVDPTGAGDVFATAFFHRFEQTGDPLASTAFANCAASFSVGGVGIVSIPTLRMVERRLEGEE